jgi:hypothetical protein
MRGPLAAFALALVAAAESVAAAPAATLDVSLAALATSYAPATVSWSFADATADDWIAIGCPDVSSPG